MKSTLRAAALATTCLWALPVFADVTPEDVWASYRGMMTSMGLELTAEESREGDTLVVRNMVYNTKTAMPLGGGSSSSTIPEMRFEQRSNGTVMVEVPEPAVAIISMPGYPELDMPAYEARTEMTYKGQSIVSGTPKNMVHTFDDITISSKSDPVVVDEMMLQPAANITISGMSGTYKSVEKDASWFFDIDMTADDTVYGVEPTEGDASKVSATMEYSGMTGKITGSFPKDVSGDDMFSTLLGKGVMDGTFSTKSSSNTMSFSGAEGFSAKTIVSSSGPSTLEAVLFNGVISYDGSAKDFNVTLTGQEIPGGSVNFKAKEMEGGVTLAMKEGKDQPFRMKVGMHEVILPDVVWAMADPTNQMSHDPANLRLEIKGTMDNETAFYDVDQLMKMENSETPPFMPKTVSLPELFLSVAGASVTGQGEGTFLIEDMSDLSDKPPFAGKLSLNLKGVQTLLNTLTASGLLPQESVMSAQMMFAMFARPGAGEDELVSELEMTKEGQMIANGQPLPF